MMRRYRGSRSLDDAGFTLVELVVVLILIAVLAVAVMPRFSSNAFDERGFHDTAKAALQHARHVAIAARRYVCVTTSAGTGAAGMLTLAIDTALPEDGTANVACGTALPLPSPGRECTPVVSNQLCAPAGVALAGDSVIFDPRGIPVKSDKSLEVARNVAINGEAALAIHISPETGWIQ